MHSIEIHSTEPLIRTSGNFLTKEQCDAIIEASKERMIPGGVVGSEGNDILEYSIRSASVADYRNDNEIPFSKEIVGKVSEFTGYSSDNFERITVHNYKVGQEFKVHQDYFTTFDDPIHTQATEERCRNGGNRVSTVIIYLNDVTSGGETFFPWTATKIKPSCGKIVHFNYNYDYWRSNIKTQHCGMPVLEGEKWIITIWIREQSMKEIATDYKKFDIESSISENLEDTEFELECGPDHDRQTLKVSLPANNCPMNAIAVAFTGGPDSSLLLYLLALLNSHQLIPYTIFPIVINSEKADIAENMDSIRKIIEKIQEDVSDGNVTSISVIKDDSSDDRTTVIRNGLKRYMYKSPFESLRFRNIRYMYLGDNALPNDGHYRWPKNLKRTKSTSNEWVQPFFDLQKYHIMDAIIKLEVFYIIENIVKCPVKHKTMDEECYFPCAERRWGLKVLKNNLFDKYFISKDES
jgi:hypothetical protein